VPEVGNASYYDTTIVKIRTFLNHFVCGTPLNCNYNGSIVNAVGAGINEELINSPFWSLYPNPANDKITLNLSAFETHKISLSVMNALGQEVLHINGLQAKLHTVDMNNFSTGI
jgi:hypothetical protein